jgi:hypothetical protein
MSKKSVNVELPRDLAGEIDCLSETEGWIKRRIHEAALRAFLALEPDEQRHLIRAVVNGSPDNGNPLAQLSQLAKRANDKRRAD